MNSYEMVDGVPETLLDYLHDIKSGKNTTLEYDIPQIIELIEILEDEYNPIRGKDIVL